MEGKQNHRVSEFLLPAATKEDIQGPRKTPGGPESEDLAGAPGELKGT